MATEFDAHMRDGNPKVDHHPYGVAICSSYANYKSELIAQLSTFMDPGEATAAVEALDKDTDAKGQFDSSSVSDSSILGNDVINPYAGFCRDDDIVHKSYRIPGTDEQGAHHIFGTGRVYGEVYDSKQQVLYIQFGLPRYRNLRTYLMNAYDGDMGDLNERGDPSLVKQLGALVKDGVITAIKLPWIPLEWAFKFFSNLGSTKVTEYFWFKETMMLYWRNVNQLMAELAVAMGLWGVDSKMENLPAILEGGPDIFKILSLRSQRFKASAVKSTDDLLEGNLHTDPKTEGENDKDIFTTLGDWWNNFWGKVYEGAKTSVLDANKFLALRIEKGSDNANESFSNTTQESTMQQRLNGMVQQQRQNTLSAETNGNDVLSWINRKAKQTSMLWRKTKDLLTLQGDSVPNFISYVASGNGFFDLPQQWCGSNFSRSANVSIRLRSKTGADPVSVYTSIMIPLCCLIAGAAPRQSGDGTYTSPFICRCWCRGMFAIPAGIIQSLSIQRGDSEFGWSLSRLPTTVSVNMQIQDLSPILYIGLSGEGSVWNQAFANNTKLHEYINTLAGLGLKQRYYQWNQTKRNASVWALIQKNTTFSPTFQAMRFGDSVFGRTVNAFTFLSAMRVGNN